MYCLYRDVLLTRTCEIVGTGWLPPMPDLRDYTPESPVIAEMSQQLGVTDAVGGLKATPPTVDLRAWCSPVENQGALGSCTANAAVGVVEYFQRRAYAKFIDGSRLFVYKTTRDLLGVTGDTGAWLRNTMGALATCGVPPEKYWPYVIADFDKEPTAFVYSIADNFEAVSYFSHDPQGTNVPPTAVLSSVKSYLAAGIPSMFGFYGFPSFDNADSPGGIPYPCPGEAAQWGHAIVAVGYDDNKKIKNTLCERTTTGALLIRNSWGTTWGEAGYGWIPYEYVLNKIALDFWSLINIKWVETGQFGF